jgi:hypothetical protein
VKSTIKRYILKAKDSAKFAAPALSYATARLRTYRFLPSTLCLTLKQWLDAFNLCAPSDISSSSVCLAQPAETTVSVTIGILTLLKLATTDCSRKAAGLDCSGQSNEKFKLFACEARVFLGMDSIDAIAHHIQDTAQGPPGSANTLTTSKILSNAAVKLQPGLCGTTGRLVPLLADIPATTAPEHSNSHGQLQLPPSQTRSSPNSD